MGKNLLGTEKEKKVERQTYDEIKKENGKIIDLG